MESSDYSHRSIYPGCLLEGNASPRRCTTQRELQGVGDGVFVCEREWERYLVAGDLRIICRHHAIVLFRFLWYIPSVVFLGKFTTPQHRPILKFAPDFPYLPDNLYQSHTEMGALTPSQVQIIKSTVPVLAEHGNTITAKFYHDLLSAHP